MDETPPHITRISSLYPFKRKPMDNPLTCPVKKKPGTESGPYNSTIFERILPLFSITQVKNIMSRDSFINRIWLYPNSINVINATQLDLGKFVVSKKADFSFEKFEIKNISLGGRTPSIIPETLMFEKQKTVESERTLNSEIPSAKHSGDIPLQVSRSTEISHRTATILDAVPRRIPEDVSWTRIDSAQTRLDQVPLRVKVMMGIVSGMVGTTVVHPLDVVKVRQQLFPKKVGTLTMLCRIVACEGRAGLYTALSAGLLRQLTYTGSRLYVYNTLVDNYTRDHGRKPTLRARLAMAVAAGMVGAFMGTPSEVALVRIIEMQRLRRSSCSPGCCNTCKQFPRHGNAVAELIRIAHREGIATWWRGGVPTVARSIFISSAQVGAYAEIRMAFKQRGLVPGGVELHVCSAVCSSLISAVLSLPVDQVKTKYQSYREKQRHVDILKHMLKQKGVMYLWKGFLPYYIRQTIHTVITYVLVDQFIDAYIEMKAPATK